MVDCGPLYGFGKMMLMKPTPALGRIAGLLALGGLGVRAQVITYDFNNGPQHGSLPLSFTVDALTATFSASPAYYGYSVQLPSDAAGVTPSGFTGFCLAPNTIYQSDLVIAFDQPLSSISLMYAPDELATDSSCTMRVTGYSSGNIVATSTTTAQPGTWPTGTLALSSAQSFDSVVVHYEQAPPTGGDYGRIFMVDNVLVTAVPEPVSTAVVTLLFATGVGAWFRNRTTST